MSQRAPLQLAAQARLMELINAAWTTQAVAVACELELPDRLALGARAAQDLAQEADVDADALARLLRALVTLEVCDEVGLGTFALGPLGPLLQRVHKQGLRQWALLNGGPLWSRWAALGRKVREGQRDPQGQGSVERFLRLASDQQEAALFHGAMAELSRRLGGTVAEALTLPQDALVVDVGGGSGELLASVLMRHPTARGLLVDQAHALAHAPQVLQCHGVDKRCALLEGSFFDPLPSDGDLYLMKSVLHDWADAPALQILGRCREAMKPGAHLVIVERPLPVRMAATPEDRALARSDLNMLIGLTGRERTYAQYLAMLERAGLAVHGVQRLTAGFAAMEVGRAAR